MTFQSSFEALQLVLASPTSFLTLTSLCLYHPQLPSVQPRQDLSCLAKSSLALTRNTREPLLGSSKTYLCQSYVQCTHFWFNFIQQKVARSQHTIVPWHQKCGLWTSGTISRIHKVETSPSQPLHYVHICTKDANAMVMPMWVFLTAGTNQAVNHFILHHHSHKGKGGHFHLPLSFENTGRVIKFFWVLTLARLFSVFPRGPTRWLNRWRCLLCKSEGPWESERRQETPEGCPLTQHMSHSRCIATQGSSNNNNSAWWNRIFE